KNAHGDFCDDTCQISTRCSGVTCDDGNSCTADRCDLQLGCVASSVTDGTTCSTSRGNGACVSGACVTPTIVTANSFPVWQSTVCALAGDGSLQCWGSDYNALISQLPTTARFKQVAAKIGAMCGLLFDGTVQCWGND